MNLGIAIEDSWAFFDEIYQHLAIKHNTTLLNPRYYSLPVFNKRINEYINHRDMRAFLRSNDTVFFEWASGLLASASVQPKTCGIVTRLHRFEMYQWAAKINWEVVDRIIVVSQAKQRAFRNRFPDYASKVVVIPEAVSVEKFKPGMKPFSGDIGILCHLKPRKRVYELILAFYELNKINNNCHLHIGGGSKPGFLDYFEALHTATRKLGLQDKVTFYNNVTNPVEWFHKIDIFISNSYSEGLQVSPMEAMASRCYCLSHHWEGAEELLPQDHLYTTNNELIELILRYHDQSETEKNLIRDQMRGIVCEKFNIEKIKVLINHEIENVYKSLY